MTSKNDNASAGFVVPIGGAENRSTKPTILKRFIQLCGGDQARIAILPTASLLSDTGGNYQSLFRQFGVEDAVVLNVKKRLDCENPDNLEILDRATGLYITGGDQLRLATIVGGTQLGKLILRKNKNGMHVAGTSAGAAFISEHMITNGKTGITPHTGMVKMGAGSGLMASLIIDQHFRQRHRLGRLITAVSYTPSLLGVGIDENTAIFIDNAHKFEVVGAGWVTIVDSAETELCVLDSARARQPISVSGLKMHLLTEGDKFNIHTRRADLC